MIHGSYKAGDMKLHALCIAVLVGSSASISLAQPQAENPKARFKTVTTAADYLEGLEKSRGFMLTKLSPEEVEKVGAALRKKYAFQPLGKALDYEKEAAANLPEPRLTEASKQRLNERERMENTTFWRTKHKGETLRTAALRLLHEGQVSDFISRSGFGFSRMPAPSPQHLQLPPAPKIPLVSRPLSSGAEKSTVQLPTSVAAADKDSQRLPTSQEIHRLHTYLPMQFASPTRSGYIKDREHIAGFGKHAFSFLPALHYTRPTHPPKGETGEKNVWKVQRMELVSLLKHREPVAYVTGYLPRMEDTEDAETRGLDHFESEGLKKLQQGEDLVVQSHLNRLTMIGSVRATESCLKCHSVKKGHLLGAFSYDIVRTPPLNNQAKQAF